MTYDFVIWSETKGVIDASRPELFDDCDADPCAKHGVCHCRCVCAPDGDDNCEDCADL